MPDDRNESQTTRVQKEKPQRGVIREPRATPWEQIVKHERALKGRNKSGGAFLFRPFGALNSLSAKDPGLRPGLTYSALFGASHDRARCNRITQF